MDLGLTEDQELLKSTAANFVQQEYGKDLLVELEKTPTGITPELLRQAVDLGWFGILIPEAYGGSGRSFTDTAMLFEELGRGPVFGPHFSSGVLGALTVMQAGTEAQKQALLPRIAAGEQLVALAVTEPNHGWRPEKIQLQATRQNGNYALNGVKLFVHDAQIASHLICAVRTGADTGAGHGSGNESSGISLLIIPKDTPGVAVRTLPGWSSQVDEVRFDNVSVPVDALLGDAEGQGWEAFDAAAMQAILILCAYKVGSCQQVYEMSVEYSRTRVQFGQPIGRFQRVQDHIIGIVNNLDAARWTTYEALWKLDSNREAASSIHLAKAVTSEAYLRVCHGGHEVHAGVGVISEYGLTLHTQRSRTLYHLLGDAKLHQRRMTDALGW